MTKAARPQYVRCGCCGGWMKRTRHGVYRHSRLDAARCNALLSNLTTRSRANVNVGLFIVAVLPPPERYYQPCLFCGLVVETDPGGLCPACLGKQQVEEESA